MRLSTPLKPNSLKRRSLVLCAALTLFSYGLLAQSQEPFFFIQGSDPQFGKFTGDKDFAHETENFEAFIAAVNRLKPAFVVVTGDLVNKPGDAAEIAEYHRIASKLDKSIPLYNIAGNHDTGDRPGSSELNAYRMEFGADYYSFRVGATLFLALDSTLAFGAPENDARQRSWADAELAKARREGARRIIAFMHHPLYLLSPDEAPTHLNLPLTPRREYLKLFQKYGVTHVFAGHYHGNHVVRNGDLELVVTGPVGKPLVGERSGFRVVIVREDSVEHKYYGLDEVPERIELSPARYRTAPQP